ncbi:hypothetical protein M0R45_017005 [Rubus argutus]|uniref:Uncharacterized protein n=1 Tax=Rubus argutus TaxID=59490 RepID=A0AAW1XXS3_RUBAR
MDNFSIQAFQIFQVSRFGCLHLFGQFVDFSSMDAPEIIDLKNNSFSGSITNFLGSLPDLRFCKMVNLSSVCLFVMSLYTDETRHGSEHTLGWLNQWACSRSFRLGIHIPWDEELLVISTKKKEEKKNY